MSIFIILLVILSLQVFTRYVLNRPIGWGEEVSLHLFVWMVFLGAAHATRKQTHPRFDVLASILEARAKFWFWLPVLSKVSIVTFLVTMGAAGVVLVYSNRSLVTPVLRISQAYIYAAVPVASFLMLVELFMPVPRTQSSES